ncbi:hypothetical protein [Fervidobacterium sp.]
MFKPTERSRNVHRMSSDSTSSRHFASREAASRRRELLPRWEYYLVIIVGFITFIFGFISLAVYFAVLYIAPIVSNLTGFTLLQSRFLLFVLSMLTVSGVLLSIYPYSKASNGNSSLFIILSFLASGVALGVQVYKLAFNGPTWIGLDLLSDRGNTVEMMYLSAVYFVYNLILFVLEYSIMKKEFVE